MGDEQERRGSVSRMVADKVTDEMLITPVGQLTDVEVAILQAALRGPHADEIMARMAALHVSGGVIEGER